MGYQQCNVLLAATTFFSSGTHVTELQQANHLLTPLLGSNAAVVFAVALLFSGLSSSITSGIAAGTIFAGMFREPYDIKDNHSRLGVLISLLPATALIFLIADPFKGLILSQMILSIQLAFTIFLQIFLRLPEGNGKVLEHSIPEDTLYTIGYCCTLNMCGHQIFHIRNKSVNFPGHSSDFVLTLSEIRNLVNAFQRGHQPYYSVLSVKGDGLIQ